MKKIQIAILTLIATLTAAVAISQPVNADIMDVVTMTELGRCYIDYDAFNSKIKSIDNGLEISDIVKNNTDGKVKLPTGYGHKISDNDLSCRQLIKGYSGSGGEWTGIIEGAKDNMSQSEAQSVLQKLGYTPDGTNDAKCAAGIYIKTTTINGKTTQEEVKTHQICVTDVGENGEIDSKNSIFEIHKTGDAYIMDANLGLHSRHLVLNCSPPAFGSTSNGDGKCSNIELGNTPTWEDVKKALSEQLDKHRQSFEFTTSSISISVPYTVNYSLALDKVRDTESTTLGVDWIFKDKYVYSARNEAIEQNGSKWKTFNDIKFTEEEKTKLHQWYFYNYFGGKIICEDDEEYRYLTANNMAEISGGIDGKKCYAIKTKHLDTQGHGQETVRGVQSNLTWYKDYTFDKLVATMSAEELTGAATSVDPSGGSQSSSSEASCYDGAGALAGLLCPIIDLMSEAIKNVYSFLESYLKIDAVLFDTNTTGGSAIRSIWGIFQGFANLFFVVIFLLVIFSQITGIGVDNYGIKKILPKLIIGAVLINMSYFICQLAVDLSNIVGIAINGIFRGMSVDINNSLDSLSVNLNPGRATTINGAFANAAGGALTIISVGSILATPAFLALGPAIIIPAVLALLSLVISIFFLFAMLALRQALAVILVIISPLAFALYMLPNTKKIYDKWFQAFKGMLIAYPIASALIYGGDLISKILLVASGSTVITSLGLVLSSAAVAIAPIFFIPNIITKSMNSIEGLGNIINRTRSGATSKLRSPAQNRLNQSRLNDYKMRRQERRDAEASDRRLERKAHIAKNTLRTMDGRDPDEMERRERVRYRTALRDLSSYDKSQADLSSSYISSLGDDELGQRLTKALENGDMEKFGSTLNEIGGRDQGKLLAKLSTISETGAWKNMNQREKAAISAQLRGQKGNPFAQAYGKVLAGQTAGNVGSFAVLSDKIQDKVKENGADNLAAMDKDVYTWMNGQGDYQRPGYKGAYEVSKNIDPANFAKIFSSNDVANAMGQVSGAQRTQFAHFISTRGNLSDDAKAVSSAQATTGINAAIATAFAGGNTDQIDDAADNGIVDASLHSVLKNTFSAQIAEINNNSELASKTDRGFAQAVDIKVGPQQVKIVP